MVSQQIRTETDELVEQTDFADKSCREVIQEIICGEIQQFICAEIAILPRRDQEILSLFYGNELTVVEISQILKIPEGTVKTRLYQARKYLKKRLEGEGYDGTEIG